MKKSKKFISLFLILLAFSFPFTSALAQNSGEKSETKSTCFKGQPLPKCKYFWITEFGYASKIAKNYSHSSLESNWYLTGELGIMRNLNKKSAFGVTFFLGADDFSSRIGIKPRYRYWINSKASLDISPGILIKNLDDSYRGDFPGFTGHLGLNLNDLLILTLQLEIIPRKNDKRVNLYGGAKLGSYGGIIGSVAMAIIFVIASSTINF